MSFFIQNQYWWIMCAVQLLLSCFTHACWTFQLRWAHSILRSFLRFPSGGVSIFTKLACAYSRLHVSFYFNRRANNSRISDGVTSFHLVKEASIKGYPSGAIVACSRNYNSNVTSTFETVDGSEYLAMTDEKLMSQCEMDTFKVSGPGGQHRNKRESAVRLKHIPTGITAQVCADRRRHVNVCPLFIYPLISVLVLLISNRHQRIDPNTKIGQQHFLVCANF